MEKVNKQNNEQTGGFVRTIQNTSAKQIHSESKDKCVPGKHVIRKERILINEPYTKELCEDLSHGKTDVLAKFQDEEKVLKKEVHKDRKDVVERCLAESHNTIKMKSTTQRQDSEKKIEATIITVCIFLSEKEMVKIHASILQVIVLIILI